MASGGWRRADPGIGTRLLAVLVASGCAGESFDIVLVGGDGVVTGARPGKALRLNSPTGE